MTAMLLEHARSVRQARGQLGFELRERVHAIAVAAKRQVAHLHQHILRPHAKNGIRCVLTMTPRAATRRNMSSKTLRVRPRSIGLRHTSTTRTRLS